MKCPGNCVWTFLFFFKKRLILGFGTAHTLHWAPCSLFIRITQTPEIRPERVCFFSFFLSWFSPKNNQKGFFFFSWSIWILESEGNRLRMFMPFIPINKFFLCCRVLGFFGCVFGLLGNGSLRKKEQRIPERAFQWEEGSFWVQV